jgi:TPR repeat protein
LANLGSEAANTSGNMAADARAAEERGDHVTAFRIYRQLAESGSADAQVIVGMDYENGKGAPQSFEEAAKWYRRAAEQGQVYGQLMLGILYATGRGVPHDPEQSAKWYRRAAEQGDASAQSRLQQAISTSFAHVETSIVAMTDRGHAYDYPSVVHLQVNDDKIED